MFDDRIQGTWSAELEAASTINYKRLNIMPLTHQRARRRNLTRRSLVGRGGWAGLDFFFKV